MSPEVLFQVAKLWRSRAVSPLYREGTPCKSVWLACRVEACSSFGRTLEVFRFAQSVTNAQGAAGMPRASDFLDLGTDHQQLPRLGKQSQTLAKVHQQPHVGRRLYVRSWSGPHHAASPR